MFTGKPAALSLWLLVFAAACDSPLFHSLPEASPPNVVCTPPPVPLAFQVQVTTEQIALGWQADANVAYDGFVVEQRTFLQPTWGTLAEIRDGAARSFTIEQPLLDTQYSFRLRGYRSTATCVSVPTDEIVVTTLPRPAEVFIANAYADRIVLDWRDPNDFETNYVIERRRLAFDREFHALVSLDRNSEQYVDLISIEDRDYILINNLDRTYQYLIYAVNASGRSQARLVSQPVETRARLPLAPVASWGAAPSIDTSCTLNIPASVVFDVEMGASYAPATSQALVDGDPATVVETPVASGDFIVSWPVPDGFAAAGVRTVATSWHVADTLNGVDDLSRDLAIGQTTVQVARSRLPTLALGDDDMAGRQALLPGCASCRGQRGSLALGGAHACAVTADGGVKCWGNNLAGQLGNGVADDYFNPVRVCGGPADAPCSSPLTGVAAIALGYSVSCIRTVSNEAKCWGDDSSGQVGDGAGFADEVPFAASVIAGATSLAVGSNHSCVVVATGQVKCWGEPGWGQAALGSNPISETGNPVPTCNGGASAPCATALAATQLAASDGVSCALIAGGGVKCWGDNYYGQLGRGDLEDSGVPGAVCTSGSVSGNDCVPLTGATAIALGVDHACAIVGGGEVRCWGSNDNGQLGDGSVVDRVNPTPVCTSGSVDSGTCQHLGSVSAVGVGSDFTCALQQSGRVLCFGQNGYGQLGVGHLDNGLTGDLDDDHIPTPSAVCATGSRAAGTCTELTSVSRLAVGSRHACAVKTDGTPWCWGYGYSNRLGSGLTTAQVNPNGVCATGTWNGSACMVGSTAGVQLNDVTDIVAGNATTMVLTTGGGVTCWGDNYYGQCGTGGYSSSQAPVGVCGSGSVSGGDCAALTGVVAVTLGEDHACAVLAGGDLACWGTNYYSQSGTGDDYYTTAEIYNPTLVCATGSAYWDTCITTRGSAIAAGYDHTCAIVAGEVMCWGSNSDGALGTGATGYADQPIDVCASGTGVSCVPLIGANAVAVGDDVSCAIFDDSGAGHVKCWGYNSDGEVGDGTTDTRRTPVDVCASGAWDGTRCDDYGSPSPLAGVWQLAAGADFVCALMLDATVKCWGDNYYGQLANDYANYESSTLPIAACAGEGAVCAPLANVDALAAGYSHGCAVVDAATTGGVRCWGDNSYGQLGDGTEDDRYGAVEVCLTGSTSTANCIALAGATSVVAGYGYTCALLASGRVLCWGDNGYGQLGDGSDESRLNPVEVCRSGSVATNDCLPLDNVSAIAAGRYHVCALRGTGAAAEMLCWGSNSEAAAGVGSAYASTVPTPVCAQGVATECTPLTGIVAVATGTSHSCAIDETGAVLCWGEGASGQLGDGVAASQVNGFSHNMRNPTAVCTSGSVASADCVPLDHAAAIAARGWNTCALIDDGTVRCWGDNSCGQLGNALIADRPEIGTPTPVTVCESGRGDGCTPLGNVVGLAQGTLHTCALLATGTVKCWGRNEYGQLGDGTQEGLRVHFAYDEYDQPLYTMVRANPVDVCERGAGAGCSALGHVLSLSAGWGHTCALVDDGTIRCWGNNPDGQLGDGSYYTSPIAQPVCLSGSGSRCPMLSDVVAVVAANVSSCALQRDGDVYCWGSNLDGELGSGDDAAAPYPAPVCDSGNGTACDGVCQGALGHGIALAGGQWNSCLLTDAGQVRCWGYNAYGAAGDGTMGYASCTPSAACARGQGPGCSGGSVFTDTARSSCDLVSVLVP